MAEAWLSRVDTWAPAERTLESVAGSFLHELAHVRQLESLVWCPVQRGDEGELVIGTDGWLHAIPRGERTSAKVVCVI
ncbi:hypothetical protein PHYPSEUDO_004286, partial [Phytophthora pseudosyringae]